MNILHQFNQVLLKISGWVVMLAMAAIALVIPYEVLGRYVLGKMSAWSGEFSQYALVWASMMGGAVGLDKGYQVGITTLTDRLPPRAAKWVQVAGYLTVLAFLSLMTFYGIVQVLANRAQTSSTMGIPMSIPYAALPLGFLIMFFLSLEQLLRCLQSPGQRGE